MTRTHILAGIGLLAAGVALGLAFSHLPATKNGETGETAAPERKPLYWVAPMDPSYRRDGPGKSPMGMDLIPVYTDEKATSKAGLVSIDPRTIQNIGVELATVRTETLHPVIETVGRIAFDEKAMARVHVRASGWVEKLHVRAVGETVAAGDALFDAYSPDLITAGAEYLQTLKAGRTALATAARNRLTGLGLTDADIADLETRGQPTDRLTVRAPISGAITELTVRDAARLVPGTPAMTITNLSRVWLIADVFETDLPHVQKGAKVHVGDGGEGTVDHIYPDLNPVTRTNPVRIILGNRAGTLRPGMFRQVAIEQPALVDAITIPASAVIRLGNSNHVILSVGDGQFRPAAVTLGARVGDRLQILSGLDTGEQVVSKGQFMLDAESSFQGASRRLMSPNEETADLPETLAYARATVNSVDTAARSLNLSHDEIPAIGWSAMTMDIPLAPDIDMNDVKPGAMIHFGIGKRAAGQYVITSIHVMEAS